MYLCVMNKNKEYLSGTLSTIILSFLNEHGEMYGYEICQMTSERTAGAIKLTEGAIYPALHRLEKSGVIVSSKRIVNGRMRKYYSIPMTSKEHSKQKIKQLNQFMMHLQSILKPSL